MSFPHEKVPDQIWEDLKYEIAKNQLDFDDNWRAFRYKDKFLFDEFKKAEKRGCCGIFDSSTIFENEKWIIACNYGH